MVLKFNYLFVDWVWNIVRNFHWHLDVLCLVNRHGVVDVNGVGHFDFLVHWNWDFLLDNLWVWFLDLVWDGAIDIDMNWIMLNLLHRIGLVYMNDLRKRNYC